jgi:hypothetical protein
VPAFELAAVQAAPITDIEFRFSQLLVRALTEDADLFDGVLFEEFGPFSSNPLSVDLESGPRSGRSSLVRCDRCGRQHDLSDAWVRKSSGPKLRASGDARADTDFLVRFRISRPMNYTLITMSLQANGPDTEAFVSARTQQQQRFLSSSMNVAKPRSALTHAQVSDLTTPLAARGVLQPGDCELAGRTSGQWRVAVLRSSKPTQPSSSR